MKKVLLGLFIAAIGLGIHAAVTTNKLGQVVTTDANGVVTSITVANAPASSTNTVGGLVGYQLSTKALSPANAAGALSDATPREIGDILIYFAAASNRIWMANSQTNWIKLD